MNTQQPNNGKTEIYSISGFKDTLASPVFYPVIVVALVLGITSILGFVQNPLKLKSMVNVIHQKVAVTNVVSGSLQDKRYSMTQEDQFAKSMIQADSIATFDVFSDFNENQTAKMLVDDGMERIAFNYDITSENFWTNLDSSNLGTASEEFERKQREVLSIGAPLKIDLQEKIPSDVNSQDASIYALNGLSKI